MQEEPFDAGEAARELAKIRRIMESATQLTVLPGWAAILGGILAVAGCGATYWILGSLDLSAMTALDADDRAKIIGVWLAVGVGAVLLDLILTVRIARRRGKNPWSRLAQLAAYAMGPSVGVAFLLSLAFALRGEWGPVPAVWMMLYGVAVWMAGILSVRAPSVLGLAFLLAGAITLFWAEPIALVMVGITFGLGHIAFGIYLLARFGS
ncbi:MAG: hypothetical protein JXA90_06950 [Planctomycetes bacterium]|nr:hypothetical protein [Planctomycetota bacterium]